MPGNKALKPYSKELGVKAVSGVECTPEMLANINRYALTPLKSEDVYVRKFLMAHNCIDRDSERFPEEGLDQFAQTMPGKAVLSCHDRKSLPLGTWFDASTETMSPQQFKSLTGEDPQLPDGINQVKVLWTWMFTLMKDWTQQLRDGIDGGIIRSSSIGFGAADLNAVKESVNGPILYWEYCCPMEATEGSLVWLGAQPGAGAQKQASQPTHKRQEEDESMKEFLAKLGKALGLSNALGEDQEAAIEAVKTAMAAKDAKIAELEPLADAGKAFQESLVADAVKFATISGAVADDEKAKKEEEEFLKSLPIGRLKMQRDRYEDAARAKCPTHATFKGKDEADRQQQTKSAEEKQKQTSGKKDFTDSSHNELLSLVGK